MSSRLELLEARRTALQMKCALERNDIAGIHGEIETSVGRVDRIVETARRLTPLFAIGGIVIVAVVGPGRAIGFLQRGFKMAFYASQVTRLLR